MIHFGNDSSELSKFQENSRIFCHSGRTDFDNIDNEALDFEQLEAFIQNNAAAVQSPPLTQTPPGEPSNQNPTNLPESPPDSGSEPPYSPNVKGNQNLQLEHMAQGTLNMNTLTELHVPHHHSLLTPSAELYLANEHQHQQQQLLQINNILHNSKHDGPLLPSHLHQASQDHMLLYQVNQSGQIIELDHIHHQNQPMSSRMYKNDLIGEMENPGPLPAIHDIQSSLQGNLNDNLQIMGDNFSQIGNHTLTTNLTGAVKKRKGASQAFIPDGDGNLKAFIKTETSKFHDC